MSAARRIGELLVAPSRRWIALAAAVGAAGLAATIWLAGRTGASTAVLRLQFVAAGRLYAEGRASDAARLYEELVRSGHVSKEVFFNLGNAEARAGRLGVAVLNYRKAWRLAPRDPDVAANLRLAQRAAGASEADLSGVELVFTALSEAEWAAAATAAWWAVGLLASLAILFRNQRRPLLLLGALPAAVAVVAVIGVWTWRGFERTPELAVLNETQNALRAPQASAPPQFSLQEGSLVRAREYQGEWVRVSYGQLSGWLRGSASAPVTLVAPRK